MTLEDLFGAIKSGVKEINVVLKTDVNGSLEAIKQSLAKIEVEDVRVKVILGGVTMAFQWKNHIANGCFMALQCLVETFTLDRECTGIVVQFTMNEQ